MLSTTIVNEKGYWVVLFDGATCTLEINHAVIDDTHKPAICNIIHEVTLAGRYVVVPRKGRAFRALMRRQPILYLAAIGRLPERVVYKTKSVNEQTGNGAHDVLNAN